MTTAQSNAILPKSVSPSHYDLTLEPQLEFFTPGADKDPKLFIYNGSCEIELYVHEKVKTITCHSAELNIQEAMLSSLETKEVEADIELGIKLNEEKEMVTFDAHSWISPGKYRLAVKFTGTLNDKLRGFYRSSYISNGEVRWLATTQFEATDARRAFPCWDEPAAKAIFKISLVVPAGKESISNMNILRKETLPSGAIKYHYAQTPKMSSYLAAAVIGDFDYISQFTPTRNVEIRVYTQPGYSSKGRFALQHACNCLEFYEKYFGIEYPLSKMDLLAIPDFAAGAMENWGCVTYREIRLFADEATSFAAKIRAARTIAHEIAHMWFGNLVTMEWWTYLWLNEGFARFMEHLAVDAVLPQWRIWDRSFAGVYRDGQNLDALETSHPVEVPINHPDEVRQIFDTISYAKGACIIRQVYHWVGPEAFQKGIIRYLKKFAYGNAITEDLWTALEDKESVSKVSLLQLNEEWVKETGYPVIFAEEEKCTDGEVTIYLQQKRFFATGPKDENTQKWKIPIHILTGSGKRTKYLMLGSTDTITVVTNTGRDWIKLNAGQTGFFRVQYGPKMLARLREAVISGELCEADRLGLLSDMCSFSSAGMVSVADSLDMIKVYQKERQWSILQRIGSFLAGLINLHEGKPYEKNLKRFARETFALIWEKSGWEPKPGESDVDAGSLRNLALRMQASDPRIQARCLELVKREAAKEKKIHPDIRSTVCTVAVKHGGKVMHEVMKKLYLETNASDAELLRTRLGAMYRIKDPQLIEEALEWRKENVKRSNHHIPFGHLCTSTVGRNICWQNFLKDQDYYKTFGTMVTNMLGSIIKTILSKFSSIEMLNEAQEFFEKNPYPKCSRSISQGLENIKARVKRIKDQGPVLEKYFEVNEMKANTGENLSLE